ncbi:hypothetical protein AB0E69_18985 [Kribbella sp. NPDC026611]|uniref:hypothetical protein n=1 Tax=Kribbella sp. NPDC026611 TaxID=3154911 RepID=UPI0033C3FB31
MKTYIRAVLIVFAAYELILGLWLAIVPKTFYDHVPTVDWTPPYSDHLFHDFGLASVGIGIVLTAAAIRPERYLTVVALLAYLAYAAPHFVFHLGHLQSEQPGWSAALVIVLALSVAFPLSALAGARRLA